MSQIICRNLSIGYDDKVILQNINFAVNKGDYLCIVGENGSGKSTLMRTILRLQPSLKGEVILGDGVKENEIGYLPQQTQVQKDFPASVREIVLSGCLNGCGFRPFYSKTEKLRAREMMEKLQIPDLSKRCYRGQQQRVLLARALCATQKLLLLDEPISGLDPQAAKDMYCTIEKLNKQDEITIVMISHDIETICTFASHILYIGESYFYGTRQEYLESDICWQRKDERHE